VKPHLFLEEAAAELSDAFEWYESRSPGLGRRFVDAATDTLHRACEAPLSFPVAQDFLRSARVFGFPYSLYFADDQGIIVVYAIFHERRNPRARIGRRNPGR
jgi:plasmid stabilization system protein ParE